MTDTSSSWLTKQPLTEHWVFRYGLCRNFPSTRHSHSVISDFWSRTRREKKKRKGKKKHSLSHPHTEKSLGRIKPIKSNYIQRTTGGSEVVSHVRQTFLLDFFPKEETDLFLFNVLFFAVVVSVLVVSL
ncbi:hypothetical protein CEXT_17391 [Caerostris extrusa]|uniref:Uncharacterized protein n=1 Tax=Caerostris extrusa TaxID=172846 RepID=A0AAV4P641_CAEEX|nr:hypothetical protein CEXT_17391 [Caerostris extrusa]